MACVKYQFVKKPKIDTNSVPDVTGTCDNSEQFDSQLEEGQGICLNQSVENPE